MSHGIEDFQKLKGEMVSSNKGVDIVLRVKNLIHVNDFVMVKIDQILIPRTVMELNENFFILVISHPI